MAKSIQEINLLPNKNGSLLTQFLSWTLSIGRLLIILTETLALGTFLYRFSLDMNIVDLHDQIKTESFIVKNFTSEGKFRNLQDRIALAHAYDTSRDTTPKIFRDIAEMGRGKLTFRSLLVSEDSVKLEAQAPSSDSLASFVNALKAYPTIRDVTIDKVENKTASSLVIVSITASLNISEPKPNLSITTPQQPAQERPVQIP